MHIHINDQTTCKEIQDVFADYYPYLRLRFYRKPHKLYEASRDAEWIHSHTTIGNIKKTHVSGLLEIQPLYKAADVENEFEKRFGLSVQVMVQQDKKWAQTTGMDDLTLKELNELGRNSSDEYLVADYDEGFEEEETEI